MSILKFLIGSPLSSLILGPIVTLLVDQLKRVSSWLDAQGPLVKQGAAFAVAALLVVLKQIAVATPAACTNVLDFGLSSPCVEALASPAFVQSLLVALVAVAVKHGQQNAKA